VQRAFAMADDMGCSLVASFRTVAKDKRLQALAEDRSGRVPSAMRLYRRAALYYLLADFFTYDAEDSAVNYQMAIPLFDRFREICEPPVEKVVLPYRIGSLMAHFRCPSNADFPIPAVIIIQGNDTVKEWVVPFEEACLGSGLAAFSIDPPGWGESGLTGNRFQTGDDMRACIGLAIDYLQSRPEIRKGRIGLFGFSLGGMFAQYAAGMETRLKALATLGAPWFRTINRQWRKRPLIQKRRGHSYTGHSSHAEREQWIDNLNLEAIISKVACPTLIVHGQRDDFYPPIEAKRIADALSIEPKVKIVSGGDHMCTRHLTGWLSKYIFDWLADQLHSK
jgi:pimeloyl-ACP methyl ester carboxylesterase